MEMGIQPLGTLAAFQIGFHFQHIVLVYCIRCTERIKDHALLSSSWNRRNALCVHINSLICYHTKHVAWTKSRSTGTAEGVQWKLVAERLLLRCCHYSVRANIEIKQVAWMNTVENSGLVTTTPRTIHHTKRTLKCHWTKTKDRIVAVAIIIRLHKCETVTWNRTTTKTYSTYIWRGMYVCIIGRVGEKGKNKSERKKVVGKVSEMKPDMSLGWVTAILPWMPSE